MPCINLPAVAPGVQNQLAAKKTKGKRSGKDKRKQKKKDKNPGKVIAACWTFCCALTALVSIVVHVLQEAKGKQRLLCLGDSVFMSGLVRRAELNNMQGVIVSGPTQGLFVVRLTSATRSWLVRVDSKNLVLVRPLNCCCLQSAPCSTSVTQFDSHTRQRPGQRLQLCVSPSTRSGWHDYHAESRQYHGTITAVSRARGTKTFYASGPCCRKTGEGGLATSNTNIGQTSCIHDVLA